MLVVVMDLRPAELELGAPLPWFVGARPLCLRHAAGYFARAARSLELVKQLTAAPRLVALPNELAANLRASWRDHARGRGPIARAWRDEL